MIEAAWNSKVNCFTQPYAALPLALSVAQLAWNATHTPATTRTITYTVNQLLNPPDPSGFTSTCCWANSGGSWGTDPIDVALQALAGMSQSKVGWPAGPNGLSDTVLPVNSVVSITINDGPLSGVKPLQPGGAGSYQPGLTSPSSSSVASKVVTGGLVATGAGAAGIWIYSQLTHQAFTSAAKHLYKKVLGK